MTPHLKSSSHLPAMQISLASESNSTEYDGLVPQEDSYLASKIETAFAAILQWYCGELGEITRASVIPVGWDDEIIPGQTLTTFEVGFTATFAFDKFPVMTPKETRLFTELLRKRFQEVLDHEFDEDNTIEWLGLEMISGEIFEALKVRV